MKTIFLYSFVALLVATIVVVVTLLAAIKTRLLNVDPKVVMWVDSFLPSLVAHKQGGNADQLVRLNAQISSAMQQWRAMQQHEGLRGKILNLSVAEQEVLPYKKLFLEMLNSSHIANDKVLLEIGNSLEHLTPWRSEGASSLKRELGLYCVNRKLLITAGNKYEEGFRDLRDLGRSFEQKIDLVPH